MRDGICRTAISSLGRYGKQLAKRDVGTSLSSACPLLFSDVPTAFSHPQTQGKIERWHQTLKNRILLENYFLPGDLEAQIAAFVEHYNHRRYHESLDNLTPADVYFGRGRTILLERERIKRKTIEQRRLLHRKAAA